MKHGATSDCCIGGTRRSRAAEHVTTACHHCVEPACLTGCPVNAYEKDPVTGIVKHLDDQCIGCQYCTFTCPYDVPKYQPAKGHRPQVRHVPPTGSPWAKRRRACRRCPNEAIAIRVVERRAGDRGRRGGAVPAGRADPRITPRRRPTYKSAARLPAQHAAGRLLSRQSVQHAHWPLVVMLVADATLGRRVRGGSGF